MPPESTSHRRPPAAPSLETQMALHERRLDDVEHWKEGVIATGRTDRLLERVTKLEDGNFDARVAKMEHAQRDITEKLVTVLKNQEDQKKEATDVAEIRHAVGNIRAWQASYDKNQRHERLRMRKISADQENARREAAYRSDLQRWEAGQRGDSLKRLGVGYGSSLSLAFVVPLATLFVNNTFNEGRSSPIVFALIAAVMLFVMALGLVYLRLNRVPSIPRPVPPTWVTPAEMILGDEDEETIP